MKYRHLFFDLDHTLWDFDTNAKDCLEELYTHFELESLGVSSFESFYKIYLEHNETLWKRFEKGYISGEDLKWKRMWRTLLDFKIADEKLSIDMGAYYMNILPTRKKVFDYTDEILQYLKDKNYEIHLLTNGFEKSQRGKLHSSHLDGYFENIITSEISNSAKPRKEIFDYALKKVGGTAEQSLMLGDNLEADIGGAQNVGMDCVFVNHKHKACTVHPTFMIYHLKELEEIL